MPSFCAGAGNPPYPFSTFDIKKYTIEGQTIDALYDHSKIAIVQNQKTLCFGDINRAYSQSKR